MLSVSRLTISDGTPVDVPGEGIVVIVGPNNAGKSAALRELGGWLANPFHPLNPPRVVAGVDVLKHGGDAEFHAWLEAHTERSEPRGGETEVSYRRHGNRQTVS